MAARMYEKRTQGLQSRGREDLVRFALSGLSCMCAATGINIHAFNILDILVEVALFLRMFGNKIVVR